MVLWPLPGNLARERRLRTFYAPARRGCRPNVSLSRPFYVVDETPAGAVGVTSAALEPVAIIARVATNRIASAGDFIPPF